MINRRDFSGGIISLGCGCAWHGTANAASNRAFLSDSPPANLKASSGCLVANNDYRRKNLGNLGTGTSLSFKTGNERYTVGSSSGNPAFDRALAETLFQISTVFGVTPTFGFIKNGNVANAFATTTPYKAEPGDSPLPTREHGTVLFGDAIVRLMAEKGSTNPEASVLALCAHEFAHIVQFNYVHENTPVISILTNNEPNVKLAELHADFLAGYYVGTAKKRNPNTPAASVALAAHVIGDFDPTSPQHHGTPKERGAAVYEGYRTSFEKNVPFGEAIVQGMRYVGAI